MTLSLALAPVGFALRRMRARLLFVGLLALAVAGAGALVGWSSVAAALAQEENVRLRLAELPPDERAIQVAYGLVPMESAELKEAAVSSLISGFADVTEPRHRVQIWSPIKEGVRLVVAETPREDVALAGGRLPAGCEGRRCEALALGRDFRLGDRVRLGGGMVVRVVGSGSLRPEALPSGPHALPFIPDPGERALLVPALGEQLAPLTRGSQSTDVATAPLDPDRVHGSELRPLARRLRRAIVHVERGNVLVHVSAPSQFLEEIADRGEIARGRLFLIAGQGAALIVAFAAFAASARRSEIRLVEEQLAALGASRGQVLASRIVEALVPSLVGVLVALVGLRAAVQLIAERRGLPSAFVDSALPLQTYFTVVAIAAAGAFLLVVSITRGRRTRFGIGGLELAAVTALGFTAWQAASTSGLDPARIAAGEGAGPVLLLLPALAFFATRLSFFGFCRSCCGSASSCRGGCRSLFGSRL
jgi:hypothetical protein